MTLSERALGGVRTRADRVRARRARLAREIEPVPREHRTRASRRKHPRRRYDIALTQEIGAEAQLPALPAIRIGLRLMTAVLLIAMLFGLGHTLSSAEFHVERATVVGNRLLSHAQVRSIAQVDGSLVFLIDPLQVVERLLKFPEVLDATIRLGWPNQVEIRLEERNPLIEWHDAGRTWWLSSDGVAFIQHGSWPDLVQVVTEEPILQISEESLDPVITPQVLEAAMMLSAQLPEIAALQYDRQNGFGFEDERGWKVYFGNEGDMTLKVNTYRAIVEQLIDRNVQIAFISLENQATPYYQIQR